MKFEILDADLKNSRHSAGLLEILDAYARDPIGAGKPLAADVRRRLIAALERQANAVILLAARAAQPVGAAVCFVGFSTFAARPLLNIHDLAVLPDHQGQGIGQALLAAVEDRARQLGCCKLTLEVRGENDGAQRLYERVGFIGAEGKSGSTVTYFMEKTL